MILYEFTFIYIHTVIHGPCLLSGFWYTKPDFLNSKNIVSSEVEMYCTYTLPLTPTSSLWWQGDVIKCKHFPCYWPFVRGIHRSLVNSPHKGRWHGALMFSLIFIWINGGEADDLRCHRAHYDVIVMKRYDQMNFQMTSSALVYAACHGWQIFDKCLHIL